MNAADDVVGLILAGGRSRRIGGGDKALLDLDGRSMLAHVIDRLRPQVRELAINANGDPARLPSLHSPFWAPDAETVISTATEAMTIAALDILKKS